MITFQPELTHNCEDWRRRVWMRWKNVYIFVGAEFSLLKNKSIGLSFYFQY